MAPKIIVRGTIGPRSQNLSRYPTTQNQIPRIIVINNCNQQTTVTEERKASSSTKVLIAAKKSQVRSVATYVLRFMHKGFMIYYDFVRFLESKLVA